jgi:hypothetical protein
MQPEARYAKSGDVHVAYQVFGEGSVDLVFVPGFISNVEHYWDDPSHARWLRRPARAYRWNGLLATIGKFCGFEYVVSGTGSLDFMDTLLCTRAPTLAWPTKSSRAAAVAKAAVTCGLSEAAATGAPYRISSPTEVQPDGILRGPLALSGAAAVATARVPAIRLVTSTSGADFRSALAANAKAS